MYPERTETLKEKKILLKSQVQNSYKITIFTYQQIIWNSIFILSDVVFLGSSQDPLCLHRLIAADDRKKHHCISRVCVIKVISLMGKNGISKTTPFSMHVNEKSFIYLLNFHLKVG